MRLIHLGLFILLLIPEFCGAVEIRPEYTILLRSTDNLIEDSTGIHDLSTINRINFKIYVLPGLEVAIRGENNYYRETIGISSSEGAMVFNYIPLESTSPLSVYLSADFSGRIYHREYSGFDNNIAEFNGGIGYRVIPHLSFRGGATYKSTRYIYADKGYKRDLDFFAGANATLPGSNSIDIEAGFSRTNFVHKDNIYFTDSIPPGWSFPWAYENWFLRFVSESSSDLWCFYFSPRWSRPLGMKSGINISYNRQLFQNYDNEIVWGFTTQYLSPWASVWEGQNVSAGIKTYLVPAFIITGGIGYWDKTYLRTIEQNHIYYVQAREAPRRRDWLTRTYFGIQYPFKLTHFLRAEANLVAEYSDNKSNKILYTYSEFAVSVGIGFRF